MLPSVAGRSFSSLNAGTITEIFTRRSVREDRAHRNARSRWHIFGSLPGERKVYEKILNERHEYSCKNQTDARTLHSSGPDLDRVARATAAAGQALRPGQRST